MKNAFLTPLKQVKKLNPNSHFITWDTETRDGLLGQELFCSSFTIKLPDVRKNRVNWFYTITTDGNILSVISFLECWIAENPKWDVVFVHNLEFDFRFLSDYAIKNAIAFSEIRTGSDLLFVDFLGLKFRDSFPFLQTKQEKAEIEWKIPFRLRKLNCTPIFNKKFDLWSEEEKERVIKHNIRDTNALYYIMHTCREVLFDISNVDLLEPLSPASLAMMAFRKTLTQELENPFVSKAFNPHTKRYEYNPLQKEADFARKSYYGGRTEVFDLNTFSDLWYMDVVSMYPSILFDNLFPTGKCELMPNPGATNAYNSPNYFTICRAQVTTIDMKYPILPVIIGGKLCFPNGQFEGIWCEPELKYAESLGYRVKILEALVFEKQENPFKPYVDKFFQLKSTSKGGKRTMAKLFLNSLYGKFGQNWEREDTKTQYFLTREEAIECLADHPDGMIKEFHGIWICFYPEITYSVKAFMNVAIASYVTSYARIKLHKQFMIYQSQGKSVIYCDTDSCVIQSLVKPFAEKILGHFDVEAQFKVFQAFAPKVYAGILIKNNVEELFVKAKGVSGNVVNEIRNSIDLNNFSDSVRSELMREHSFTRYMKFRSAIRSTGSALATRRFKKTLTLEYTKRKICQDLTTFPLNIKIENGINVEA